MSITLREQIEFQFRNVMLQRPLRNYRPIGAWNQFAPPVGERMLGELKQDGLTAVPAIMSAQAVQDLRTVARQVIDEKRAWQGYSFSEKNQIHNILQPILTIGTARAALSSDIRLLCESYFRRPVRMTEADYRYAPAMDDATLRLKSAKYAAGESTMHWHYDPRGKMLKIQIYLTDTLEDGQNFSYLKASHTGFRALSNVESRFSDDHVARNYAAENVTECYGTAGDGYLFDPNGIHRLRRKDSIARETVTFYYTPGRMRREKKMYVPADIYEALTVEERTFLNIGGIARPDR